MIDRIEERLLHLVGRARHGVLLPEEADVLYAGVRQLADAGRAQGRNAPDPGSPAPMAAA
ncbi:hypothetical protein ACFRCI_03305 [Streptomyces sp. NPDC056638]|uniref:hypothetical protein n=1 Tax=Streptomyces sp. NPDC056638 TaxID=3345887 RepID=UPI00369F8FBD